MLFEIWDIEEIGRPEFRAAFLAERLIERRASPHPLPFLWVAMFRPVEPFPGADVVLAVHYQTSSVLELAEGDWFTAREVRGYTQERGWATFRTLSAPRLDGMYIGPSQFICEGGPQRLA
jgi:hypothetical protein